MFARGSYHLNFKYVCQGVVPFKHNTTFGRVVYHILHLAGGSWHLNMNYIWQEVARLKQTTFGRGHTIKTLLRKFAYFTAKKVTICAFHGSESHCKELYRVLQLSDPQLFTQTKALDDILF